MIKRFCERYLSRRGYMVIERRVPMLLVSGNAVAVPKDVERLTWTVHFPAPPHCVALIGSVVAA